MATKFDMISMDQAQGTDGYAVVAADGVGTFPVIGEARAGTVEEFTLEPGQVAYITTGAPIPNGANAVVQVEDTEAVERDADNKVTRVKINKEAAEGQDIRTVGSDIARGTVVLPKDTLVGPAEVGLLASVDAAHVVAYRKPTVAVLSTGDELVEVGTPELQPGQIRDSNRPMLLACLEEAGCNILDLAICPDDPHELRDIIEMAQNADDVSCIISSGGVSMGDRDYVKELLQEKGHVHFNRVRMKPGKPLTFATLQCETKQGSTVPKLFFGLPGNPVSSLVCFYLVVQPCLHLLHGRRHTLPPIINVCLGQDLTPDPTRPEYHRVTLEWHGSITSAASTLVAHSTGGQRSSRLLSARSAQALVILPQTSEVQRIGSVQKALLLPSSVPIGNAGL